MAKRRQFRRPMRRPGPPRERAATTVWRRDTAAEPVAAIEVRPAAPAAGSVPSPAAPGSWELVCREGWEWTRDAAGRYRVRVAPLTTAQAEVVRGWVERMAVPATWWAVSRELAVPDSEPLVAAALAADPWLLALLPGLLEASTEGAPPPPEVPHP